MTASRLLVGAVVMVSGCQFYEFRRVEPFAVAHTDQREVFANRRLKPNVMLLVDNSGSMKIAANPQDPRCAPGCGQVGQPVCAPTCPTRVTELKSAMSEILATRGDVARFGLTIFPQVDTDSCRAPVVVNRTLPPETFTDDGTEAALIAQASLVNQKLQEQNPVGGTPTAAALDFVGADPSLNADDGRLDLVLLLTDGVPNCNLQNVDGVCGCLASGGCSAAQTQACACTQSACTQAGNLCSLGCLDDDGAVGSVKRLRQREILTAVVGFGTELQSGDGPAVLKAMADEGGFARKCPDGTDAECGGSTCDVATKRCVQSYFSAANRDELRVALEAIWNNIGVNPCVFELDARPDDETTLAVLVDSESIPRGDTTWTWDAGANTVSFKGELCTRLTNSTVQHPVALEFRIAERL